MKRSARRSPASGRGRSRTTDSTGWCCGAGLGWREIVILRAYCKYLRQAGVTFSQAYMEDALAANPAIAAMLVELFHARLDPARQEGAPAADEAGMERLDASLEVMTRIEAALDEVANLDEDRILRSYIGVIRATLRTNYFQCDSGGSPKSYVSFKLDPHRIPELPSRGRCTKSSCIRPGWRGCTCAAARWRGGGSAGRTGARTSAPRCWGSRRRRW